MGSEIVQEVKTVAAKSDNLSYIPGTALRGKQTLASCPLTCTCTLWRDHPQRKIQIQSNASNIKIHFELAYIIILNFTFSSK